MVYFPRILQYIWLSRVALQEGMELSGRAYFPRILQHIWLSRVALQERMELSRRAYFPCRYGRMGSHGILVDWPGPVEARQYMWPRLCLHPVSVYIIYGFASATKFSGCRCFEFDFGC